MQAAKANIPRRLNGKQPVQPPKEPPTSLDRRLNKKQKVQTHLDAWFTPRRPLVQPAVVAAPPSRPAPSLRGPTASSPY